MQNKEEEELKRKENIKNFEKKYFSDTNIPEENFMLCGQMLNEEQEKTLFDNRYHGTNEKLYSFIKKQEKHDPEELKKILEKELEEESDVDEDFNQTEILDLFLKYAPKTKGLLFDIITKTNNHKELLEVALTIAKTRLDQEHFNKLIATEYTSKKAHPEWNGLTILTFAQKNNCSEEVIACIKKHMEK